ncbi:MAG: hypothetical protein AB8G23_17530 [Myxococcota bacterium]
MSGNAKQASNLDLSFFRGFSWPVPEAFSSAIAAFRFEPGDVLYDDVSGYAKLGRRRKKGARAIQVLERPSSSGGDEDVAEGDPRRANWESRVQIALHDLASGTQEILELTQGDLFMTVWRGEEAHLHAAAATREEPASMPLGARDLAQWLGAAGAVMRARSEGAGSKKKTSSPGSRFLFVVDQSSDASRAKARTIEEGLEAAGSLERADLSPSEAGAEAAETFHPALMIRCLSLPGQDEASVTAILRQRLYGGGDGGGANAGEETVKTDRFSVGRHGLLEPLEAPPSEEPEA